MKSIKGFYYHYLMCWDFLKYSHVNIKTILYLS